MRKHLKNYFIPHEHNDYKPHSVRKNTLIVIFLFALVVIAMVFVGSSNVSRETLLAEVQEAFLVKITNENRQENDVSELSYNLELEQAAKLKVKDMIDNQYFAHVSPQGKNPWYWLNQVGYKYQFAGENLAIDFYDTKKVAQAWMDSPTHRKNILNSKYTEIGIAVGSGRYKGKKVAFVVQMFATPRDYPAQQINKDVFILEKEEILAQETSIVESNIRVLGEEIKATSEDEIVEKKERAEVIELEDSSDEPLSYKKENNLFTETTFIDTESPVDVINTNALKEDLHIQPEFSGFMNLFSRPAFLGKNIILLLIGLLSISLLFKVFIEFKKQHYINVLSTLVILSILVLFYIFLSTYISQVFII